MDLQPANPTASGVKRAAQAFALRYGNPCTYVAAAPGRVNLIGEHVDYSGGVVLPMAIDRYTAIAVAPAKGRGAVRIGSGAIDEPVEFHLADGREAIQEMPAWARYVLGVVQLMAESGQPVGGFDAWVESDIPLGAGLSSSAALEVATSTAVDALCGVMRCPMEVAALCQRAEHEFAGMPCGIMDMAASAAARAGHAVMLDCRSGEIEHVPMRDASVGVLIANTNVKHALVDGAYAERRRDCERAAKVLEVGLLREATPAQVESACASLGPIVCQRAAHVVGEIDRTLRAAECLRRSDWSAFGELMYESHTSLRDQFEVSCAELDAMVDIARSIGQSGGVYGSRMTGGGFGGCTVSLVRLEQVEPITERLQAEYKNLTGIESSIFLSVPSKGAHVIDSANSTRALM